jgi:signal transduction histidine kinase/ActR/RegA family two-component response regulator
MSKKDSMQNEIKKLTEERNLYAKFLEGANIQFEEKVRELSLLKRVGDIISSTFDIESFCRKLVSIVIEETPAENCSLLLKDKHTEKLILRAAFGARDKIISFFDDINKSSVTFSVGEGVAGKVALEGKVILIDDVKNDERFDRNRKSNLPISSLLCCPLVLQNQVLGAVNLSSSQTHAFNDNDMRSITVFSAFVSSILNNAISYNELEASEEELKEKTQALTIANKELKRAYSELESTQENLIKVEKMKALGELTAGIAHDFNNVLAAILGRVQLLSKQFKPLKGKQEKRKSMRGLKAALEVIEKASLDGAETVRRIQEFSRRRADDKDFTKVDIKEIIEDALEFTKVRWKGEVESKGIQIKIKKELPPLTPINGSPSELREVFTNLINNAIDAMPQGGTIRIESFMDDSIAVIRISDTGKGIPKDITDRIFDPFFTTKDVKSTGLGLSVSYGIINRHRGTITVDSVEGEGTTFTIKFPIAKKTGKGKAKEEKIIPINRKQKKASILVIEDEEDVRELLRDILKDAGHRVEVANDGSEGIEIFKKNKFDLVFTDLGMPVMSGWEVAEKVKSINEKVPVALITGWNVKLDGSEMNDSGINLVIQKPFKMEQILNLVQDGMLLKDQLKAI